MIKPILAKDSCSSIYILCFLFLLSAKTQATDNSAAEAKLITASLYQITKFSQWPNLNNSNSDTNYNYFNLCTLGSLNKHIIENLNALEAKTTQTLPIQVTHFKKTNELLLDHSTNNANCHILFSVQGWADISDETVKKLNQTTLLIGNSKKSLNKNGMIALLAFNQKTTIFINKENLSKTPIKLESRLKALTKNFEGS